jgi:predicted alpha/beta hydrolase family esterase
MTEPQTRNNNLEETLEGDILHKQNTFVSQRKLEIFQECWLPKNPKYIPSKKRTIKNFFVTQSKNYINCLIFIKFTKSDEFFSVSFLVLILFIFLFFVNENRASLFIIHGLGEHSGRWHHFALYFAKRNFAVFIHDHEGHGHTPTPKKTKEYFDRITPLLDDCVDHIHHNQELHSEIKELPCFLLGHSMGGAIAIRVAMMQPQLFRGVIISAPAMGMLPGSNKFLYLTSKYVKHSKNAYIQLFCLTFFFIHNLQLICIWICHYIIFVNQVFLLQYFQKLALHLSI